MRYVTITGSRFYNNAAGIVPNALDSEKFPPAEDNVIRGNEIFWNNFNFHKGAPFKIREDGTAALVPVGTGVLLLAGRRNVVEQNQIYGNWSIGVAALEGILLADEENQGARALVGNRCATTCSGWAAPTSTAASSPTTATAPATASGRTPASR